MHAVIANGGKQYRVEAGQTLRLERMNKEVGERISVPEVLLLSDGEKVTVGAPHVSGAAVELEVVSHGREKKIQIIKFRRRKHHMKQMGHRQDYTEVKVVAINEK